MKIAFLVNDLEGEDPRYATTLLANEARRRGHSVYYVTLGDFVYETGGELFANARVAPKKCRSYIEFLRALQDSGCRVKRLAVEELDVLWLRADPAREIERRPWAQTAGVTFGRDAARRGVLVLNDPWGLSEALNKFYFQSMPEAVRPKTMISRNPDDIKEFARQHRGRIVLKPLQGSGGQSVFLVRRDEKANLNQMIEAVSAHGYVVAQEYLPAADDGDVRLFVMNGKPLQRAGKYAAVRRVGADDDLRSNMHAGGEAVRAEVDDEALRIAELVRPQLLRDGHFLAGLDIVGDKLLEINVFSPGALYSVQKTQGTSFTETILDSVEDKVACAQREPGKYTNAELAVL